MPRACGILKRSLSLEKRTTSHHGFYVVLGRRPGSILEKLTALSHAEVLRHPKRQKLGNFPLSGNQSLLREKAAGSGSYRCTA